jgi:hypothetical protein
MPVGMACPGMIFESKVTVRGGARLPPTFLCTEVNMSSSIAV